MGQVRLLMSKHSGSMWTVSCTSNSTSPSCRQRHGPIASSIPLRAAPLLLGGNSSDPVAQAQGACPSRGKFTRRTALHGLSDVFCLLSTMVLHRNWGRSQKKAFQTVSEMCYLLSGTKVDRLPFFLARCCLGQVPGGAPFSQRSEQAYTLITSPF